MSKRVVAIVGRPNVGKSALFNSIAGRRIAIVHSQSGVTRDRLMREVHWQERVFDLVDTGGLCLPDSRQNADVIESAIREQVGAALEDAVAVILVADATAGITPLDEDVAAMLRGKGLAVIVAANKCDSPERDVLSADFERLGFPVFPVSALQNRGLEALMQPALEELPDISVAPDVDPVYVAVVGRPNVGKSSYLNRLLRSNRVIVSDQAGTTRDSVDIAFEVGSGDSARHYVLIDTAGMKKRSKVKTAVEKYGMMRAGQSIRRCDLAVLLLDAAQGPTAQDKKIASEIQERQKGCIVAVNKWDLSEDVTQREYAAAAKKALPFLSYCPLIFLSAKSGYNIRRSIDAIDYVAGQVREKLPTGALNKALHDAQGRTSPPSVRGKQFKIYYAVQTGVQPVSIRLFVNDPALMVRAYESYLVRSLRENFGLEGAPVKLQAVPRREKRR